MIASFFLECLPAGLLIFLAVLSVILPGLEGLLPIPYVPNFIFILIILVFSCSGGIISSDLAARLMGGLKNRIYLKAIREIAASTSGMIKRQIQHKRNSLSVDGIEEKQNIQAAAKIMDMVQSVILKEGQGPERIRRYDFMARMSCSFILPFFFNALAFLYLDLTGQLGVLPLRHAIPALFIIFSILSWLAAGGFFQKFSGALLCQFMEQEPVPRAPAPSSSRNSRRRGYRPRPPQNRPSSPS